jgi:UDP-GlcNAc:undecaprenyl-phosphate GlcNAc-1-phosphate transferase
MGPLIWLALRAFVIALILTPIVRDVFRSYGLVDRPDTTRKIHPHPIPRVGGIAIFIAYFLSFWLSRYFPGGLGAAHLSLVWTLLPAVLVVFAVGLIDDFIGLRPWQKIVVETAAAGLAYWSGVRIYSVVGLATGDWWSLPLTIVWLVACTNAFNLVDGLDGLAAGVGLFATLTMFTGALLQSGSMPLVVATLPLAGCLLGFLCYNFNPATIFLGDCGSLLIGFLLGCYGVVWSQKSITMLGMTAPLIALSIPLLDVILAVARRFLKRQPIFGADRRHIHHRLIELGLTPRRAVLLVYGLCGLAAALSLLQSFTRNFYIAVLLFLLVCSIAWIGIRYLRYSEFILAGRIVVTGEFHRALNAQLAIDNFSRSLDAAGTVPECWTAIRQHYRTFGFCAVLLSVGDVSYQDGRAAGPDSWTVRIPLSEKDFIEFSREFRLPEMSTAIAPVADLLRQALAKKPAVAKMAQASS